MLLYIVRHGKPDYITDTLLPEGRAQAEAVGKFLAKNKIDEIYSSPLGRAKETAMPLCKILNKSMNILPFVSEKIGWENFTVPITEDKTYWAFSVNREKMIGDDDKYSLTDSFGHGFYFNEDVAKDNFEYICKSSDDFLFSLGYKRLNKGNSYKVVNHNNKRVAVFCHEGLGLHWLSHLLNIPPHIFTTSFDLNLASVTIIEFDGKGDVVFPKCIMLSDMSHYYKEDLPRIYVGAEKPIDF